MIGQFILNDYEVQTQLSKGEHQLNESTETSQLLRDQLQDGHSAIARLSAKVFPENVTAAVSFHSHRPLRCSRLETICHCQHIPFEEAVVWLASSVRAALYILKERAAMVDLTNTVSWPNRQSVFIQKHNRAALFRPKNDSIPASNALPVINIAGYIPAKRIGDSIKGVCFRNAMIVIPLLRTTASLVDLLLYDCRFLIVRMDRYYLF
jgi:hypothetical protein